MNSFFTHFEVYIRAVGFLAGSIIVGLLMHLVLFAVLKRISERTTSVIDDSLMLHLRSPVRLMLPILLIYIFLPVIEENISGSVQLYLDKILYILLVAAVAWLLIRLITVLEDFIFTQYQIDVKDNLRARKIHTQIQMLRKILTVAIFVLALSAILMSFQKFRQLGTGLLASAGLAGIILGFAAQRTLGNLLAGIQLAITQPIRLDDVVIVEGEWGRIEEITLTYVVVRIWDLRRLILPISYFIEKPFQNWTRVSADLLGTVYLYVDYTVPIQEVRDALHQILQESEYWDSQVWRLHTTDIDHQTIELRALMSAADSSAAWELRCEVREKLIEFIREKYPDSLPKFRADLNRQ